MILPSAPLDVPQRLPYRKEIDGIRAFAVIAIILFHAGFSAFPGGFVGVDIFFVISGFLITAHVVGDIESGTFSLARFYERRVRRIVPALVVVLAACLPFAWSWLVPADLKDFCASLVAVALFGSNIWFWRHSGYFDTAAERFPLLHTWSLGVEEQFYLLFPLVMLLVGRIGRRRMVLLVTIAAMASLALAHWAALNKPAAAFYLLPTRVWEFAIGALLALRSDDGTPGPARPGAHDALAAAGLLMIGYAVFAFSENTPFPGLPALVPTAGTALLIRYATPATHVGRWLGTPVLVSVGLVSYSAYLWHQPLFAFARWRSLAPLGEVTSVQLIAATFVLAYLTWRFVERPFRRHSVHGTTQVLAGAVGASLSMVTVGWWGLSNDGFESRYALSPQVARTFARTERVSACFDAAGMHQAKQWLCTIGDGGVEPSFLVVGDSHARSLFEAFDAAARQSGRAGVFTGFSGCVPFLEVHALRSDQAERNCNALNSRVLDLVRTSRIRDVFLVARWAYYTDGGGPANKISPIGLAPDAPRSKAGSREAFAHGLAVTIRTYSDLGVRIHIVTQVPQQHFEPRQVYYRAFVPGSVPDAVLEAMAVRRRDHLALQAFVNGQFLRHPRADRLSFDDLLCDSVVCRLGTPEGSYYVDDNHLSLLGAKRLEGRIAELLKPIP